MRIAALLAICATLQSNSVSAGQCPGNGAGHGPTKLVAVAKSIQSPEKKKSFNKTRVLVSDRMVSYITSQGNKILDRSRYEFGIFPIEITTYNENHAPAFTTRFRYTPTPRTILQNISHKPYEYRVTRTIEHGARALERVKNETATLLRTEVFHVGQCTYDVDVIEFRLKIRPSAGDIETDIVIRHWYSPKLNFILRTERGHKYKDITSQGAEVVNFVR